MKSITFTAVEFVARAREKFRNSENKFCYGDIDAALDDALYAMKRELEALREEVDRALAEPGMQQTPDLPDWDKLERSLQ